MNGIPATPTKATDPIGAVRYAMSQREKKKMVNTFLHTRAAMYSAAPSYNPWHDPAVTGGNGFENVEEVAPVNLRTTSIPLGNARMKRPSQNPFGNLGRLPGEPPAAPKKSRKQRRQRRRATRRRTHY